MAGFIHNELDIKLLVLYIASKLAGPVDFSTLTDLAMCDDGVDYFHLADYIQDLVDSGQLSLDGGMYTISDVGRRNIADGEGSLSPVIRKRCDQRLAPLNAALRRKDQVRSEVTATDDGFLLRLALNDSGLNLFTLSLWSPTKEDAQRAAARFQDHPDQIYNGLLGLLLEGQT